MIRFKMAYKLIYYFLILLLFKTSYLSAAAYNLPSHLINIPVYTKFDRHDIISGISNAFYTVDSTSKFEFDSKVMYAVSNRLLTGFNLINEKDVVMHIHYQFYSTAKSNLKITGGMTDIPIKKDPFNENLSLTSLSTYPTTQKNTLNSYLSFSYLTSIINYHAGFGLGRFQYSDQESAFLKKANGLFFGIDIPIGTLNLIFEYDGKDFNIGGSAPLTNRTMFFASLTEFYRYQLRKDTSIKGNPQYNNTPVRWFTFGITHRFNFSKLDEEAVVTFDSYELKEDEVKKISAELSKIYEGELNQWRQERKTLITEIERLKNAVKEDIRYIDKTDFEKKEEFRQNYLATNQEISEKVLSYYYESFEYYTQKKYYEAIQILQKAIALDPYLPQLYVRMGSVYFDLNLIEMALMQWEKALELDPDNISLSKRIIALRKSNQETP